MLGPTKVRRIFGDHTGFGLVIGWLIGMLLPVCSLGVIPIVRELHRAGVKRGTIVAFGLTAPLFNPMSVLYGLTMSDPIAIMSFSLCAMVIVSLVGFVWNRIAPTDDLPEMDDTIPSSGVGRTISVFDSASRELVGTTMVYFLIGIAASVALAMLLPNGYLQNQVDRDYAWAPIVVAGVATPIYSTPLLAMSQIGGMFQHGNSIGAAFSLLILGAGTNVGLLAWLGRTYGVKRFAIFIVLLVTTTVGLAYLIDKPLYPKGVEPLGHTHAFDVYTNPFRHGQADLFGAAQKKIGEFWLSNEFGGTYLLGGLIIMGCVFKLISRRVDLESWYIRPSNRNSKLDREVPSWVLGVTVVTGLIGASVVGTFLYYLAPTEALRDLYSINSEVVLSVKTKDWEAAEKWIPFADDLSRRLEVGVYLRSGSVSEFKTTKARSYREKLDELKMLVDTKDEQGIQELAMEVQTAYRRMSAAFKEEKFKEW